MDMYTIPDSEYLKKVSSEVEEYMVPNNQPYISVFEGYLTSTECDEILRYMESVESYNFPHCNADTKEVPRPLHDVFWPIETFGQTCNDLYWKYDLDDTSGAWMQSYKPGQSYQLHMDGSPGRTRKLTAVAFLTDPDEYEGGDLKFYLPPNRIKVPKTRGTIVVFPHWLLHEVTPVRKGLRQTINLGFWGPPFR